MPKTEMDKILFYNSIKLYMKFTCAYQKQN